METWEMAFLTFIPASLFFYTCQVFRNLAGGQTTTRGDDERRESTSEVDTDTNNKIALKFLK